MDGQADTKNTWADLAGKKRHGRACPQKKTTWTGNDGVVGRTRPSKNTTRPKSQLSNFARPNDGWTGLWVRPCHSLVHSAILHITAKMQVNDINFNNDIFHFVNK